MEQFLLPAAPACPEKPAACSGPQPCSYSETNSGGCRRLISSQLTTMRRTMRSASPLLRHSALPQPYTGTVLCPALRMPTVLLPGGG